jgi:hypothetical protein
MGEERVAFELFHHCNNAIVAADSQVIPLGDIVGENNARTLADARKDGE